jgi:hypothetical protein
VEQVDLTYVNAPLAYLGQTHGRVAYSIYPPSSGRKAISPPKKYYNVPIFNCRPIVDRMTLDQQGYSIHVQPLGTKDLLNDGLVKAHYYPEVESLLKDFTRATAVIAFDHNVRSAAAAQVGVRPPVDAVHGDYTDRSGQKRVKELLQAHGKEDLSNRRSALINVWRPIRGPVQDIPLALCDAQSASPDDFVETEIDHFAEGDLLQPSHSGQIYSVRYNPKHRWYYVADMLPEEMFIFKCYDSLHNGVARFTPHTGFKNPNCPSKYLPRESIEVRTVVIY